LELQTRPVDGRRVDPAEVVDLLYDLGHGAVLVGTDGVVALPRMEGLLAADVALGMTGIMGFDTTVRHLNVILPGPVARRLLVSHLAGFEFMPGAPLYAPPVSSPLVSATSWDVGQRDCGDVELRVSFGALCPGVHVALAVLDCAIIRAEVAGDLSDQELSSLVGHLIRRSPL